MSGLLPTWSFCLEGCQGSFLPDPFAWKERPPSYLIFLSGRVWAFLPSYLILLLESSSVGPSFPPVLVYCVIYIQKIWKHHFCRGGAALTNTSYCKRVRTLDVIVPTQRLTDIMLTWIWGICSTQISMLIWNTEQVSGAPTNGFYCSAQAEWKWRQKAIILRFCRSQHCHHTSAYVWTKLV